MREEEHEVRTGNTASVPASRGRVRMRVVGAEAPMSFIHYYADPLGHGRAIMRCDIVVDGAMVQSYTVGSPAPLDTVRRYERRVPLS